MASKTKQIQIDLDLFLDLYFYHCGSDADRDRVDMDNVRQRLKDRAQRLIDRELYSAYITTPTNNAGEREDARMEYLRHRGILASSQSDGEYHLDGGK